MPMSDKTSSSSSLTVLVPQHVSCSFPTCDASPVVKLTVFQSAGITWRALVPILLEAPRSISLLLVSLLVQNMNTDDLGNWRSSQGISTASEEDFQKGFDRRTLKIPIGILPVPKVTLVIVPPTISPLEPIFSSVVLRTELMLLRMQTLAAWWATLGGGYFFCRRLHVSFQLAKQQRAIARQIGNVKMERQCTINEAYNLIYAGKFRAAKIVLRGLETSIDPKEDPVTLNQCYAARLLAKRLKQVAKEGLRGYYTNERGVKRVVDDFQRVRIVGDYRYIPESKIDQ